VDGARRHDQQSPCVRGSRGGSIRVSLTYEAPGGVGKTTANTDTYHGRFFKLSPNEKIVEVLEFETVDPALQGEMTVTITRADAGRGTDVLAVHENLPPGVAPTDNEAGWRLSLDQFARSVETDSRK